MSEDRVLTTLTRTNGANQALKDGTVTPSGFSLRFEEIPVLVKGFRRMVRSLEFDVSEMALTTYLAAREHGVAFTALPIFLVRGFHHGAIRYNTRSGIRDPKDIEGRRVGVNRGYTVTTGVWARGILASECGVDLSRFKSVKIAVRYEGPGRSLRAALKNKNPRYRALGAPTDEKINETSLPMTSGSHVIEIDLDQLVVPEWWKGNATPSPEELARPDLRNIVAMELLTGVEAEPGRHRLRIEGITFEGSTASAEAWYSGLAFAWLLIRAQNLRADIQRALEVPVNELGRDESRLLLENTPKVLSGVRRVLHQLEK